MLLVARQPQLVQASTQQLLRGPSLYSVLPLRLCQLVALTVSDPTYIGCEQPLCTNLIQYELGWANLIGTVTVYTPCRHLLHKSNLVHLP